MYLLYLDDSGSAGNKNETYLVLGDLSLFERQVHWITNQLDNLAAKLCPSDPRSVEFHASEMFSGRCRTVQLADHVAYAVFRRYEAQDTSYFDIISSRFDEHDNKVHGLVHKQSFDPRCMCVACATRRAVQSS